MGINNISDVMTKETVVLNCKSFGSKNDMFDFMAEQFVKAGVVKNKEKYIKSLYEREELGSTYMGNLIGLPHGKCGEVIKAGIGFCRCRDSFKYESYNEIGDVKYIFMLAIPKELAAEEYMRTLADLATLLLHDGFLEALDLCNTYEDVIEKINQFS